MTNQTRADRIRELTDENLRSYEDESRATGAHMTEQDANKLAAAINDALKMSGQAVPELDREEFPSQAHGLTAVASLRPTGETRGIIQIVDGTAWYVMVGNLEGCVLYPKWYLKTDVEVVEVAHALMMVIEDADECVELITAWDEAWI